MENTSVPKLKYAGKFQLGQYIRSYDFQPMMGRLDSYIEGLVIETLNRDNGYDAYKVLIKHRIFDGKVINAFEGPLHAEKFSLVPHETPHEYVGRIIEM